MFAEFDSAIARRLIGGWCHDICTLAVVDFVGNLLKLVVQQMGMVLNTTLAWVWTIHAIMLAY